MARWDPDIYASIVDTDERPAQDLMSAFPAEMAPREIWDLGCGMGEQAALLAERFPQARVRGLDSSPDMLRRARALSDQVEWIEGGIEGFAPDAPADLIFTNAALHWVSDHKTLIPRLAAALAPSGVLAIQVPVVDSLGWRGSLAEVMQVGTVGLQAGEHRRRGPNRLAGRLLRLARAAVRRDRHLDHHLPACLAWRRSDRGVDDGRDLAALSRRPG